MPLYPKQTEMSTMSDRKDQSVFTIWRREGGDGKEWGERGGGDTKNKNTRVVCKINWVSTRSVENVKL